MGLQPFKTRFSSADDQERRLSKSAMSGRGIEKAVILAAGLGTRMRKADGAAPLDPEQAAAADTGVKAMIPIGRPFLDYVISALADSGIRDICLVIGPAHDAIRDYYAPRARPLRRSAAAARNGGCRSRRRRLRRGRGSSRCQLRQLLSRHGLC